MEQFGTKDDAFVYALARGQCRLAPELVRFEKQEAVFRNGSRFEPDMVVLCTGFETKTPFLQPDIAGTERFLNTFVPEVGDILGFVGFLRPGLGAIPPLSELQARWFALVQSELCRLPPVADMEASIAQWRDQQRRQFGPVADRLEHLVDFTVYCDALAAQVGCKPRRDDLQRESWKFRLRFYAGPFAGAQYRLTGPGARPQLARRAIESMPVAHRWPDLASLYLRWTLSRILHRVKGPEYRTKLTVD